MTENILEIFNRNKKGKNDVLIIAGPTCSGKSSLALNVAQKLDGEIVSCDSMQIYKMMDVGTAKATLAERALVPHHMIDIIDPWENYNAFAYKNAAVLAIRDIISRGKLPIICGGTGLYVNTLIDNREFADDVDESAYAFVYEMGADEAYEKLLENDPAACEIIHKNNEKRVKRALVLALATGKTMAQRNAESHTLASEFNFTTICLMPDREKLYENIDSRVDKMFEMGLFDEAKKVYNEVLQHLPEGADPLAVTALSAIGYKELLPPDNVDLDFARAQIKLDTRHYAKRQITWFKKTPGAIFLEV